MGCVGCDSACGLPGWGLPNWVAEQPVNQKAQHQNQSQLFMASTFGQPLLQVTRQNFNLRNLDQLTESMESQFPVSLLTTTNSDYATLPKIVVSPAFRLILIC